MSVLRCVHHMPSVICNLYKGLPVSSWIETERRLGFNAVVMLSGEFTQRSVLGVKNTRFL